MTDSPPLAAVFTRALPPGHEPRFAALATLEATLQAHVTSARAAWPTLELEDVAFIEHLAQRVSTPEELTTLHAADLWLALACLLGDPAALSSFDSLHLSRVPASLRGALPAGMTDDDLVQGLRLKLFVRRGESPPGISGYSGRGSLVHWLRASAVRLTQDFARTRKLEVATPDDALVDTPAAGVDADMAYLKSRFAPEFKLAFQEALSELSARDQNLLRLQYLDGVSPEEIGRLYQAHRTTVWRWLTECREALLQKTKEKLAARVVVGQQEFSSLMNAVHSNLDVSLSRMLRKK